MESPPLQSLESTSQTSKNTNSFQTHPRIKPLIRRNCQEKDLNEKTLAKFSTLHCKTFKTVKFQARKETGRSAKDIRRCKKILREQDSLSSFSYQFFYHLSSLSYQFLYHQMFESLYLTSKLKSLSCLSLPNVDISRGKKKVFLKCLVNLKNLGHFSVESAFYHFGNSFVFRVLRSLLHIKKLKSLSLKFGSLGQFRENEEQTLMSSIGKLTQLGTLKLSFLGSIFYDEQNIMKKLAPMLPKLTQLTVIDLDFQGEKIIIQDAALMKLFQSLKALKDLSDISLNLLGCFIFHKHDDEILKNCLLCLNPSLIRKVKLGFNTNLHSENLIKIFQTLQRFTSLNVLHLNLSNYGTLNDKDMSQLSETLNSLILLSSLCLIFPWRAETGSTIGDIVSALKNLRNLQHFKLKFADQTNASPCQVQEFFSSLKSLKFLKFLEIEASSIQDSFLEGLGEALKELTSLKALSLNSPWNRDITDIGIEHLCRGIGQRDGLLSLILNVAECEIGEQAIESIAEMIRSLDSLWSVNLRLYRSPMSWRKEENLSSVLSALKKMRNIKEVALTILQSEGHDRMVNELGREKKVEYSPQYDSKYYRRY